MTRDLGAHPNIQHSYWNPQFQNLAFLLHDYHTPKLKNIFIPAIVFSPHNFKILRTCYMELFWVSNLEIGRNYASIIIMFTVPVSHNVLCFGYFIPISHGIKKKTSTVVSPPTTHPSYQIFIKLVCCFARITLSTLFLLWSIRLLQKIMIFQIKAIFFFQLIAGLFRFCCLYVF